MMTKLCYLGAVALSLLVNRSFGMECVEPPAYLLAEIKSLHSCVLTPECYSNDSELTKNKCLDIAARYETCVLIEGKLSLPQSDDAQKAAMFESYFHIERTELIKHMIEILNGINDKNFMDTAIACANEWNTEINKPR